MEMVVGRVPSVPRVGLGAQGECVGDGGGSPGEV